MDGTNNAAVHSAQGIVDAKRFTYLAEIGASSATGQGPLTRPLLPSVLYKPQNL